MLAGEKSSWKDFLRDVDLALQAQQATGGAGLRILTEAFTSPTLQAQRDSVLKRFPNARWHEWDPTRGNSAGQLCLVGGVNVVVAPDSDFLFMHPEALQYARDFSQRRQSLRGPFTT